MNYKRLFSLLLVLCLTLSLGTAALAAETQTATVPVTLTVINNLNRISVTCPASLPIAVVDGYVVTATNAKITNTASSGSIRVTNVEVRAGALEIGDYADFQSVGNSLALSINGCGTEGAGSLPITAAAFPVIEAGTALSLDYAAKVAASGETLSGMTAAYLIFTLSAA
jgi:hypothetical protein